MAMRVLLRISLFVERYDGAGAGFAPAYPEGDLVRCLHVGPRGCGTMVFANLR